MQARTQERRDQQGDHEIERQRGQHNQGQPATVVEHHAEKHHRKQHVEHDGDRIAGEEGADVFQLTHPGNRIADTARLEIAQRQVQQMVEQSRTKLHVDATGGMGEHVAAQPRQDYFEDRHHQQTDGNHVQRREPAVHQHLVHHHLEEQRRNQREEIEHEGNQQHLAKKLAVFDDGGNEPGEIELRHLADQ